MNSAADLQRETETHSAPSSQGAPRPAPAQNEDEELPKAAYAALAAFHAGDFIGFLAGMRLMGRELPERISPGDIALLGAATHKLSRLLSRATVTRFLRAPFTDYRGPAGFSELKEAAKGTGLRRAIGQLISCPFCTGVWVASFLTYGLTLFPRATRLVASVYSVSAISDFLQLAYDAAEKSVKAPKRAEADGRPE